MGKYTIKELERLSGIKAHTLRIWEKRYNIFNPDRTKTNIRTYSDSELKKLLNISILNQHGYKISKIADLSEQEMINQVSSISSEEDENLNVFIDQLTIAMVELDENKFEKHLSNYILRLGFEKTITEVMYPFLEKIGILWLSGNITPIQEHFISNLIRQKIIVAIDGLTTTADPTAEKVVMFLPEDELHEIGLLFYYYLVKSMGYKTYYLGQYVPLNDLERIVGGMQPKYLVTSISHTPADSTVEDFITHLTDKFPNCIIIISGEPVNHFSGRLPENVRVVKSARHFKDLFY